MIILMPCLASDMTDSIWRCRAPVASSQVVQIGPSFVRKHRLGLHDGVCAVDHVRVYDGRRSSTTTYGLRKFPPNNGYLSRDRLRCRILTPIELCALLEGRQSSMGFGLVWTSGLDLDFTYRERSLVGNNLISPRPAFDAVESNSQAERNFKKLFILEGGQVVKPTSHFENHHRRRQERRGSSSRARAENRDGEPSHERV